MIDFDCWYNDLILAFHVHMTVLMSHERYWILYLFFQAINRAMEKDNSEISVGILDIYGFEIFQVWASFIRYFCFKICLYTTCSRSL